METGSLVKKIVDAMPKDLLADASMCVLDAILVSKKGDKMPSALAKELLYLCKNNQLNSRPGLAVLLEAALAMDPEETKRSLSNKGLASIAEKLPSAVT